MRRHTVASRKTLTAENLAGLGADRLADILLGVADTRPDLKRRLRMEVAAEQGAEHLVPQIDKRLATLETSRGQVTWRQKPAVIRDLDALRGPIAERLAGLARDAALERMWLFLDTATPVSRRFHGGDDAMASTYIRAAGDLGRLLAGHDPRMAANRLVDAIAARPQAWAEWLPATLEHTPQAMVRIALEQVRARQERAVGWLTVIRHMADAAGDTEAFRETYPADALATPAVAVQVARRNMAADQVDAAGKFRFSSWRT